MLYALSKFITIPSISCDPAHREDCRQGAIWLRKCLGQLGAHTLLVCVTFISLYGIRSCILQLPTGEGNNPIVLATFEGSITKKPKRRILFYGYILTFSSSTFSDVIMQSLRYHICPFGRMEL